MKKFLLCSLGCLALCAGLVAEGPLKLGPFLVLESPRLERSHLDINAGSPGVRLYLGASLPAREWAAAGSMSAAQSPSQPIMYTFSSSFKVDASWKKRDMALYLGLFEYPFRIYLNGVEIAARGRYAEGQYNSSLRTVESLFLSPDLLHFGSEENSLVIEAYPKNESWGLDRLYIDRREAVDRAVFLRNFVGVDLIQGSFVLSLVISLYFFALFLSSGRKNAKNLIFSLLCVSFCLSYLNVTIYFDADNEALLETVSKTSLIIMAGLWLLFCCEMTSVLNKHRILPLLALALNVSAAVIVGSSRDKSALLARFGCGMNFLIVPELILAFCILLYAYLRKGNRSILPELLSYVVIMLTTGSDVYHLNRSVLPYAWLTAYGYLAIVVASFATLVKEQSDLYRKNLRQTGYLREDQKRIQHYSHVLELEITKRVEAEQVLRDMLGEKDLLLREINHRVKNNLNVIKSLVQLQANRCHDAVFQEASSELIGRIFAISLVHDQLNERAAGSKVEPSSYLESLVGNVAASFGLPLSNIRLDFEAGLQSFPTDTATSLGLIVNEVLTNAIKYAAPLHDGKPDIAVSFSREGRDYHLTIIDNGPGPNTEARRVSGACIDAGAGEGIEHPHTALGLLLVRTLARTLGGRASLEAREPDQNPGGARFDLVFPADE